MGIEQVLLYFIVSVAVIVFGTGVVTNLVKEVGFLKDKPTQLLALCVAIVIAIVGSLFIFPRISIYTVVITLAAGLIGALVSMKGWEIISELITEATPPSEITGLGKAFVETKDKVENTDK